MPLVKKSNRKKWASGDAIANGASYITVTGLNFVPSFIITRVKNNTNFVGYGYSVFADFNTLKLAGSLSGRTTIEGGTGSFTFAPIKDGFYMPLGHTTGIHSWIAFE